MTFASSITFQNHVLLPAMTYKVVRREDDDALDEVRAAGASGRWTEAAFAPDGAMPMRELASRPAQEPGRRAPQKRHKSPGAGHTPKSETAERLHLGCLGIAFLLERS